MQQRKDEYLSAKTIATDRLSLIFGIPISAILAVRVLWSGVTYPESNIVVLLVLAVLFTLYLLVSACVRGLDVRFSRIDACFLTYFVIMFLLYLSSDQRWLADGFFILMFSCTLAYFLTRYVSGSQYGATVILVGLFSGVMIVSLYGLYQFFWGFAETRALFAQKIGEVAEGTPLYSRLFSQAVFSTFFFPNALAGYLVIMIPLAGALFVFEKRRVLIIAVLSYLAIAFAAAIAYGFYADIVTKGYLLNGLYLVVAVLLAGVVLSAKLGSGRWLNIFCLPLVIVPLWALSLTASEAAWLALFCAVAISTPLLMGKRKASLIIILLLLVLAMIVLYENLIPGSLKDSMEVRYGYWGAACKMWREQPLYGIGQGMFPHGYARLRSAASEEGRMAHSIYLHFAAEMGIAGLAAFAFLWISFLLSAGTRARGDSPLCFAVFISVCAFLLHGVVGVSISVPGTVLTLWVLAGLSVGSNRIHPGAGYRMNRPLMVIMAILLITAVVFWIAPRAMAARHRLKAIELAAGGREGLAQKEVSKAISLEPGNPVYLEVLADILDRQGKDTQALEVREKAAVLGEGLALFHFKLAIQNWRMSDDGSSHKYSAVAVRELRKAIQANPHDLDYHLLLGNWLEKTGQSAASFKEYRYGLELISVALGNPGRIRRHSRADYEKLKALVEDKIAEISASNPSAQPTSM
jgi:hypothetical protein